MIRTSFISTLILTLLIGTIGMPINVHSCGMKREKEVARSCGMCDDSHGVDASTSRVNEETSSTTKSKSGGCCDNYLLLKHHDRCTFSKTPSIAVTFQLIPVLFGTLPFQFESVDHHFPLQASFHPPPLERLHQRSWLFYSAFLI